MRLKLGRRKFLAAAGAGATAISFLNCAPFLRSLRHAIRKK